MLAEAGLLDDAEATTHWSASGLFRTCYPNVDLRAERVLVPAGAEHRIVTSGGSASWTDLALYLIARFAGDDEARRIAKIFLFGDRSDGQLPFAAMVRPKQHEDAAIAESQVWIADRYAGAHPVAAMAERSGLTERTFKRRFKAATGYAPLDYVQMLRIEESKQALETTSDPIDEIAAVVGYDNPNSFQRLFQTDDGHQPEPISPAFQERRAGIAQNWSWRSGHDAVDDASLFSWLCVVSSVIREISPNDKTRSAPAGRRRDQARSCGNA